MGNPLQLLYDDAMRAFRGISNLAVAVSGGADSMAAALLSSRWAEQYGISLFVFIVDHQLRPESSLEALQAQQYLKDQGLHGKILRWYPVPFEGGCQEKARHGRYQTLAIACHQMGIQHLVTGHHQDDLLETFYMRKQRESDWRGLAGISQVGQLYGLTLVRPLLNIPKKLLVEFLKDSGVHWVDDPSNGRGWCTRNLIRHQLEGVALKEKQAWLVEIAGYANRRVLEAEALRAVSTGVKQGEGYLQITWSSLQDRLQDVSKEGYLLLESWVRFFRYVTVSRGSLMALWKGLTQAMKTTSAAPKGIATLGGCFFMKKGDEVYIFREYRRILPQKPPPGTSSWVWDHRFFCYNRDPVTPKGLFPGDWKDAYAQASFPKAWPSSFIRYYPFSLPWPLFQSFQQEN